MRSSETKAMKCSHVVMVSLVVTLMIATPASAIHAQEGTLVRAAAKEAVEFFAGQAERQGAKAMAKELTEFGGEAAVREVFEQVAKESGEEGVKSLIQLSKSYGIDAIRAAKVAPRLTTLAERVSPELAPALCGHSCAQRNGRSWSGLGASWLRARSKRLPNIPVSESRLLTN